MKSEKNKVVEMATIMFIGARLFSDDKSIEETCSKFNAIKLPIIVLRKRKQNGS